MRKGKSIIGTTILSLEDGTKLETVSDLVVDPEGRRVVALVATEGGFMSSSRVIPSEEITSFGKDAVIVRGRASVVSVSSHPQLRALVEQDDKILGKKVFTTNGDEQGSIADIYFEEQTGAVVGYEVSGGVLGDASKGTSYLATDEITTIGEDVVYIHPATASVLEEQVGGIQGALQGAGQKLGEARDTATEKLGQARDSSAERLSSGGPTTGDRSSGTATAGSRTEDALLGKKTGSDVETDSGSVIVPKGRRIRPEDVAAAKAAGKLPALTAAAAMGGVQDAGAGVKDGLGSAGDTAGSLWDQFIAKIGEMTDATGRRVDEEQTKRRLADISDAVGRPVTKVILDRDDNVILNLGDIITHQSVQRAHESGGLDSLLSSVYKGTVEFTKEEMRAPAAVEAQATVDKASGGATVVEELETKVSTAEQEREAEKERKAREAEADRRRRETEREGRSQQREAEQQARQSEDVEAPTARTGSARPSRPSGGR